MKKKPTGKSRITHRQLAMAIEAYAAVKHAGKKGELADSMGLSRSTMSRLTGTRTEKCITNKLALQFKGVLDYCRVQPYDVFTFGYTVNGEHFECNTIYNQTLGTSVVRYYVDDKEKDLVRWEKLLERAKGASSLGGYEYEEWGFVKEEDPLPKEEAAPALSLAEQLAKLASEYNGEPTEADMEALTRSIIDEGNTSGEV